MKYCLNLKYRDNALFRKDLLSTDKLPVEDATATNYASNLFWGTKLGIKMLSEEEFEALIASVPSPTAQLAHETKCEPESTPSAESAPAQLVMPIQGELF